MIQGLIDGTFAKFKSIVREGRGKAYEKNKQSRDQKDQGRELAEDWESFADGRVLSGTEAMKRGFVDELGGFAEAVTRRRDVAAQRERNQRIKQQDDQSDFQHGPLQLLRGSSRIGEHGTSHL